jgi:hypothetical protein
MSATGVVDRAPLAWRLRVEPPDPALAAAAADEPEVKRQRKEEKRVLAPLFGGLVAAVGLSSLFGEARL